MLSCTSQVILCSSLLPFMLGSFARAIEQAQWTSSKKQNLMKSVYRYLCHAHTTALLRLRSEFPSITSPRMAAQIGFPSTAGV